MEMKLTTKQCINMKNMKGIGMTIININLCLQFPREICTKSRPQWQYSSEKPIPRRERGEALGKERYFAGHMMKHTGEKPFYCSEYDGFGSDRLKKIVYMFMPVNTLA